MTDQWVVRRSFLYVPLEPFDDSLQKEPLRYAPLCSVTRCVKLHCVPGAIAPEPLINSLH